MNTRTLLLQIERFDSSSAHEYRSLLKALADYYQQTVPSAIEDQVVLATELLLNRFYEASYAQFIDSEIQELILEALSKAGSLSYNIRRGTSINTEYFRTMKILGRTLSIIVNRI